MISKSLFIFKTSSNLVRFIPLNLAIAFFGNLSKNFAPVFMKDKSKQYFKHQKRVNPSASDEVIKKNVSNGFYNYGRYWIELLKIPYLSRSKIISEFTVKGYEHIEQTVKAGKTPILVLPHLGGWEWGAAWLKQAKNIDIAAVVEKLEPDDVFNWFKETRESIGIEVISLGNDAFKDLINAVRAGKIVCLLADRDISKNGVVVDFFGESTTLPSGPALLALRTKNPIIPTAIFYDGKKKFCEVLEPINVIRTGDIRTDIANITQEIAKSLEYLIANAPDQWHLLNPNWPSDVDLANN